MDQTPSQPSTSAKLLYRPVGLVSSIVAGAVAGAVFKQVWKRIGTHDEDVAPGALQSEYDFREILLAAALQGAIFSAVRAVVDRQGARVFQRATGEWPGS